MNSQETLWFIGKCLSLAVHPERASEIQNVLQSGKVNWKSLVYQSSNQLVLPALYLNLQRNNLLSNLPTDLVEHLEDITSQNRKRNQSLLNQVKEISSLLRNNGLEPIYLKGTAHLLDGLYEDNAERMLSDIDFLLEEKDAEKAWQILKNNEYSEHNEFSTAAFGEHRHLTELIKIGEVASVEVHTKVLIDEYDKNLNYSHIEKEIKEISKLNAYTPSDRHLLLHNIMNAQMNDKAKTMHKALLRNSYDLMLLSKRVNPLKTIQDFNYYFDTLNTYIAVSADILAYPRNLEYKNSSKVRSYIKRIHLIWNFPGTVHFFSKIYFILFRIYRYISQFFLFFFKASVRKRITKSLSNPKYYQAHWAMYKKWFS